MSFWDGLSKVWDKGNDLANKVENRKRELRKQRLQDSASEKKADNEQSAVDKLLKNASTQQKMLYGIVGLVVVGGVVVASAKVLKPK